MAQRKWNGYTKSERTYKSAGTLELFNTYKALTNWLCQSSGWAQTPLSPVVPALHLHSPAVHLPWIVWGLDLGPVCSRSRCRNVSSPQRAHAVWPLKFSEQILCCFDSAQWFDSSLTNHCLRLDVQSIHNIMRLTNCRDPTCIWDNRLHILDRKRHLEHVSGGVHVLLFFHLHQYPLARLEAG